MISQIRWKGMKGEITHVVAATMSPRIVKKAGEHQSAVLLDRSVVV